MATPLKRDDSSLYQFVKRVPADVLLKARGTGIVIDLPAIGNLPAVSVAPTVTPIIKLSLGCCDQEQAKARHAHVSAHLGHLFDAIRRGPGRLTLKEAVALAGDVYRHLVELNEEDPGTVDNWSSVKAFNRSVREGRISAAPSLAPNESYANETEIARSLFGVELTAGIDRHPGSTDNHAALEARFGIMANRTLMRHGLVIDALLASLSYSRLNGLSRRPLSDSRDTLTATIATKPPLHPTTSPFQTGRLSHAVEPIRSLAPAG